MPNADIEIGLQRWWGETYAIELRFRRPGTDADLPPVRAQKIEIDFKGLLQLSNDIPKYGALLSKTLFSSEDIRNSFIRARAIAEEDNIPLRLRLMIDKSAPELNDLCWEALRDPERDSWLLTSENV